MDEAGAVRVGLAFARQIKPSVSGEGVARLEVESQDFHASERELKIWKVQLPGVFVEIDAANGKVVGYEDEVLLERCNQKWKDHGKQIWHSPPGDHGRAKQVLDELGWSYGTRISITRMDQVKGEEVGPRVLVEVTFHETPHGYEAPGGNQVLVGLDSLSGEVVRLEREIGFTYGPPVDKVGYMGAQSVFLKDGGPDAKIEKLEGPRYERVPDYVEVSERGRKLRETKTLPLAYEGYGRGKRLLIAADNGEILAREERRYTTQDLKMVQRVLRKKAEGRQLMTIVWVLAGALAVFIAVVVWMRRSVSASPRV